MVPLQDSFINIKNFQEAILMNSMTAENACRGSNPLVFILTNQRLLIFPVGFIRLRLAYVGGHLA